ncbi:succinylglutamate desuccinylase/aspartoacylase family protein [Psychrosphaera sp. B3R10]|nr:succinylglutamate desuccinylase/aspartoacylase family protein [Psychrosphaera sp. I2R16]MBU2990270.1 succinylglutamate desuccinylase/aspartoacylase family protein [Psychrosphaera sp. B3R10]
MAPLKIGEFTIMPGEQRKIELPVAKLYTDADVSLPVHIFRSKKPGPTIFISAAVHGDELNGIEIIRRLITQKNFKIIRGTVIAVPMVNVYGVVNQSRYMPDRRDLNRCFPGSSKGSLAGRVAFKFLNEIVKQCDYGIDLHTGAIHRSNLPQIRADLTDDATKELAQVFGVPVVLHSNVLDGSLRQAAVENDTKVLLYEAGEALRFDEFSIRAGMKGILNVLQFLGMMRRSSGKKRKPLEPFIANSSGWMRANASGIVHNKVDLGDQIEKNDILAEIGSPFGEVIDVVKATRSGILIGKQNIPLVQEGEAMFHIADFEEDSQDIVEQIETVQGQLLPDGMQI